MMDLDTRAYVAEAATYLEIKLGVSQDATGLALDTWGEEKATIDRVIYSLTGVP